MVRGRQVLHLRVERSLDRRASRETPEPGPTKEGRPRDVDVAARLGAVFDRIKAERKRRALARGWHPVPAWMFVWDPARWETPEQRSTN